MDVNGLRCIVTGAASGIGDAVTRQLVEGGAEVVSLDRHEPTATVSRHVGVDLADPASIDSAVHQLGGGWDVLANVAGIPGTADGELVFKVNFLGARHLTEALLDKLNPGSSIVNVSSTAGFGWPMRLETITEVLATTTFQEGADWFRRNTPDGNAYNFSKEAFTVYTHSMGLRVRQLGGHRINTVLPGPVDTPILADFEKSMGQEVLDGVKGLVGRHATAADIAPAVVFFASRDSSWINGASLVCDGGLAGAVLSGLLPPPQPA